MPRRSSELIAQRLKQQIRSGDLQAGQRLAPVRQLAQEHGISYVTALRRIHELCDEGYLERRHGSGVFVKTKRTVRVALVPGLKVSDAFVSLLNLFADSVSPGGVVDFVVDEIRPGDIGQLAEQVEPFDVAFLSDYLVTQGLPLERFAPLDGLVDLSQVEQADYYPQVYRFFAPHGQLRMLPLVVSPVVMFVNRSLMRELGLLGALSGVRSLGRLADLHGRVRARCGNETAGLTFGWDYKRLDLLLRMLVPEYVDATDLSFQTPAVRKGLRALKSLLARMGLSFPDHHQAARERFVRGDAWALLDLTSYLREIRRRAAFELEVLPLPTPRTELWCAGLAITTSGLGKPGVRELLKFFKSPNALEIIGREGGFVPARRSVAEKACATMELDGRRSLAFLADAISTGYLPDARALALNRVRQTAQDAWDLL